MNKEYKEYLESSEWAQIKVDLYISRGKKCELCESTKNIAIHHRTYDRIFNEEPSDLIILCGRCHFKIHKKEIIKKKKRKLHPKKPKLSPQEQSKRDKAIFYSNKEQAAKKAKKLKNQRLKMFLGKTNRRKR
jgi:5-methylcytosine-specific restriction endonuclease McrA